MSHSNSTYIHEPSVAGMFYPRLNGEIKNLINTYLSQVKIEEKLPIPKAMIVPHAGYIYSGLTAAYAYSQLQKNNLKTKIKNVILFGPSHKVSFRGIATSNADYFKTPLGNIKVNKDLVNKATSINAVQIFDDAFNGEHCLEVQFPFLQMLLDDFTITPFLIGDATPESIKDTINLLWGGNDTLILISSDLSHFHTYEQAQQLDHNTSRAILAGNPKELNVESACGRLGIKGMLMAAKEKNMTVKLLDYRNSGDTAGDKNSVVGYGAYIIF